MWNFHISKIFIHLDVYLYPIHWPAPSWLASSIGRVLHRYRRGRGFKSRTGLNFFQVLFTTTRFSSVLSCEDLLISSLHRSAIMWNFHISKILNQYCSNFLSCLLVACNEKIIIRNKIQVTRRKETLYNILCWLPSTLLIKKAIQLIIILEFHGTSQGLIPSQLGRRRLFFWKSNGG